MKVFTYSEARQRLADVLTIAKTEEVIIKRRGGETFSIIFRKSTKSPFLQECRPCIGGFSIIRKISLITIKFQRISGLLLQEVQHHENPCEPRHHQEDGGKEREEPDEEDRAYRAADGKPVLVSDLESHGRELPSQVDQGSLLANGSSG